MLCGSCYEQLYFIFVCFQTLQIFCNPKQSAKDNLWPKSLSGDYRILQRKEWCDLYSSPVVKVVMLRIFWWTKQIILDLWKINVSKILRSIQCYGCFFCEMWVLITIHTRPNVSDFNHLARNSSIFFFCTSKFTSLLLSEFHPSLLGSFSISLSSTII